MRLFMIGLGIVLMLAAVLARPVLAGTVTISPTSVELTAPANATVFRLNNPADRAINIQVRLLRWSQQNGEERLEPTDSAVASPPFIRLQPGQEYVLRVLRTDKRPVQGEESYRLVIDALPEPNSQQGGVVNFLVRQIVPVFFRAAGQKSSQLADQLHWRISPSGLRAELLVTNNGGTRMRLSDVVLRQNGQILYRQAGTFGTVLQGATMRWPITLSRKWGAGPATISLNSDAGPGSFAVSVSR